MKLALSLCTVATMLTLLATPAFAAKKEKAPAVPAAFKLPATITLTDEQKTKLEAVKTEFGTQVDTLQKKAAGIITEDQKKARHDAAKAAKLAGKKGKEAKEAIEAASPLSADQKKQQKEVALQTKTLNKQIHDKIVEFLTPEQKEMLTKKKK